jgi:OmpA-OmpF porin, OOP family
MRPCSLPAASSNVGLVALTVLLVSSSARAQDTRLDVERFKPAVTYDNWVNAEGSGIRYPEDRWQFGAYVNYGWHPLVILDPNGNIVRRVVGGRMGFDLLASATIAEPFAIGVALPVYVLQSSDYNYSSAGLGDLRLVPKLRLLDDTTSGVGLALLAELRIPTHTGDFSGPAGLAFLPRVAVDHRFRSGIRLGANAGALIQQTTDFLNVRAGSELVYAVAGGYRFGGPDGKVELGAELFGGIGLQKADREELPLEALPYLKFDPTDEWQIQAGPGIGIVPGYGVPTLRFFAGVRYSPTTHDADHDGVPDDRDRCPNQAEEDEDSDGVPDAEDKCPNQKETINGFEDDDGCPDEGPAKVIVEKGQIRILEQIHFKTGSAEIDPKSHSILDQVALTMKANRQIKRVRVEGHTDETGSRERNLELSKDRANSVRNHILRRGVKPERVTAEGFGEERPLARGKDPASLAKNRRVEFIVDQ